MVSVPGGNHAKGGFDRPQDYLGQDPYDRIGHGADYSTERERDSTSQRPVFKREPRPHGAKDPCSEEQDPKRRLEFLCGLFTPKGGAHQPSQRDSQAKAQDRSDDCDDPQEEIHDAPFLQVWI